jgi:hypothetical protein
MSKQKTKIMKKLTKTLSVAITASLILVACKKEGNKEEDFGLESHKTYIRQETTVLANDLLRSDTPYIGGKSLDTPYKGKVFPKFNLNNLRSNDTPYINGKVIDTPYKP